MSPSVCRTAPLSIYTTEPSHEKNAGASVEKEDFDKASARDSCSKSTGRKK